MAFGTSRHDLPNGRYRPWSIPVDSQELRQLKTPYSYGTAYAVFETPELLVRLRLRECSGPFWAEELTDEEKSKNRMALT